MAGKKQTLTIHALSAEHLELVVSFLTGAFQDYKDSGDAPEQTFYELGEVESSPAMFET